MSIVIFCAGLLIGFVSASFIQKQEIKEIEKIIFKTNPLSKGIQCKLDNIQEESDSESYEINNYNDFMNN